MKRFIPYLFAIAVLSNEGLNPSSLATPPTSDKDSWVVTTQELRDVMNEGTAPARADRRPGFSEITYAQPETSASSAGDQTGRGGYLDFADELPVQPGEPQRQ